jgi:hypothetical protein
MGVFTSSAPCRLHSTTSWGPDRYTERARQVPSPTPPAEVSTGHPTSSVAEGCETVRLGLEALGIELDKDAAGPWQLDGLKPSEGLDIHQGLASFNSEGGPGSVSDGEPARNTIGSI